MLAATVLPPILLCWTGKLRAMSATDSTKYRLSAWATSVGFCRIVPYICYSICFVEVWFWPVSLLIWVHILLELPWQFSIMEMKKSAFAFLICLVTLFLSIANFCLSWLSLVFMAIFKAFSLSFMSFIILSVIHRRNCFLLLRLVLTENSLILLCKFSVKSVPVQVCYGRFESFLFISWDTNVVLITRIWSKSPGG